MTENPYQSPAATNANEISSSNDKLADAIEFESDWSLPGLRRRRAKESHRLYDTTVAVTLVLFVASLVLHRLHRYGGLACIFGLLFLVVTILWLGNVVHRLGSTFKLNYPGLAAKVSGRISDGMVVIHGPDVSLVTLVEACPVCDVAASSALVHFPGMTESLPINGEDIQRHWTQTPVPTDSHDSIERMFQALSHRGDSIQVSGRLLGSDFRGLNCWRSWLMVCSTCGLIALSILGWIVYQIASMPRWVLNPPDHYHLSQAESSSLALLAFLAVGAVAIGLTGAWHAARMLGSFGEFTALISPNTIAVARKGGLYAYRGESLQHFQWMKQGLVVFSRPGNAVMLIPTSWFDLQSREQAQRWFSRSVVVPKPSRYIQPTIT